MALWFPLFVNSTQIGEVEVIRRLGTTTDPNTGEPVVYVYDWTVSRFQTGITKKSPEYRSGELTHVYDDGAFELVRKVLNAYAGLLLAETPPTVIP